MKERVKMFSNISTTLQRYVTLFNFLCRAWVYISFFPSENLSVRNIFQKINLQRNNKGA